MKRFSKKRAAQEREYKKLKDEIFESGPQRCFFLKYERGWQIDHIVPRSQNQSLIAVKENLIPISDRAHFIITFGTNEQIKKLPNISLYLEKMKELDEDYYNRFITNHEL